MLPCLARPLSLSCHATTIAQLDVSVCLMFKRVVLCTCAPCCLAPAVFSLCPGCSYPSEGKPCIFLGGYLTPSTGVSSFVRLALTHGLLCSMHGVLLVLCCSCGLELLPCHCLLPCLLHSGIKARMHRAFIFLKKKS